MTMTYRQGDVLLVRVDAIPAGTPVPRDRGRLVLAYGEVTGHAHVIDAPPESAVLTAAEERRFLRLVADVPLVHEEHGTITVPAGAYEVRTQYEWDAEAAQRVLD